MFWLLILAGIIAGAGSLQAQRYLGGISGTVADQTGAILPGAQLVAVEEQHEIQDGSYCQAPLARTPCPRSLPAPIRCR